MGGNWYSTITETDGQPNQHFEIEKGFPAGKQNPGTE